MPTKLKKGDKVKIIDWADLRISRDVPEPERNNTFDVERKFTDRWNGQQYVDVSKSGRIYWGSIPIEKVLKINTKLYEIKRKLIEEVKEDGIQNSPQE